MGFRALIRAMSGAIGGTIPWGRASALSAGGSYSAQSQQALNAEVDLAKVVGSATRYKHARDRRDAYSSRPTGKLSRSRTGIIDFMDGRKRRAVVSSICFIR